MESVQTKPKRKRVSKKNKKSWRKYSNIKDIEDFLEDKRLQERTGGIIADKEDGNLFFVDNQKTTRKTKAVKKDKYFFRNRPLKCHSYLLPDPTIPRAPKAIPRVPRPDPSQVRSKKLAEYRKNGTLPAREMAKMAHAIVQRQAKRKQMKVEDKARDKLPPPYNIWETGIQDDLPKKLQGADHFFLVQTKRIRNKVPKMVKPNRVPSVEVADAGASYNPSFEDHQKLLQKMYDEELLYLKKEEKLANWSKGMTKLPPHKVEENYLHEMSAGLFESEPGAEEDKEDTTKEATEGKEDTAKEEAGDKGKKKKVRKNVDRINGAEQEETTKETTGEKRKKVEDRGEKEQVPKRAKRVEEDEEPVPIAPTTSEVRKTRQQKRRQRLRKSADKARAMAKAERVRLNDVYRLRSLRREIILTEKQSERTQERRAIKKDKFAGETKQLGRHRFEEGPVAFKLSSELTGSLRSLKPEGCMVTDRWKSIQKRNLVESRIWKRGEKRNLKECEKRGYREFVG